MEENERNILRSNHAAFIEDLEPREILAHLYQDGILTENDLELISEGQNRRQRCQKLLFSLPTRGPQAYGSFKHALRKEGYVHLSGLLEFATNQAQLCQYDGKAAHCTDKTFFKLPHSTGKTCAQTHRNEPYDAEKTCAKTHRNEPYDVEETCAKTYRNEPYHVEEICAKTHRNEPYDVEGTCAKIHRNEPYDEEETCVKPHRNEPYDAEETCVKTLGDESYNVEETFIKSQKHVQQDTKETFIKQPLQMFRNKKEVCTSQLCPKCKTVLPSDYKDLSLRHLLQNHCCLIIDNVEPRDITDLQYQERVLNADECERIHDGATRKDRCAIMLHILATKPPRYNTVTVLMHSLSKKYNYVVRACAAACYKRNLDTDITKPMKEQPTCDENFTKAMKLLERTIKVDDEEFTKPMIIAEVESSDEDFTKPMKLHTNEMHAVNEDITKPMKRIRKDTRTAKPKGRASTVKRNSSVDKADSISGGKLNAGSENHFSDVEVFDGRAAKVFLHEPTFNQKSTVRTRSLKDVDKRVNKGDLKVAKFYKTATSVSKQPSMTNKLQVAFNFMSSLINQGQYDKFDHLAIKLDKKFQACPDMKCLISYLRASKHLYGKDFKGAKENIENAMEIVSLTTNPKYFTVELYTAKTRMYISQKKLKKLEDALDDIKQVIEFDPTGCSGRAAGWLYMNDGRNKTTQICMLNFGQPTAISAYNKLFGMAKKSFTLALYNFETDGGRDGPFGAGYAVCRLAILLLGCGDNGMTMDVIIPTEEDIKLAGGYLQRLEESEIPINKILSLHYYLAKSDYQFRKSNIMRAYEYAQSAEQIAEEIKLQEFADHAHNRVVKLKTLCGGSAIQLQEIRDEQEFNALLLSDMDRKSSTDS